MRCTTRFTSIWISIGAILASCFLALPIQLIAQNTCSGTRGQNGVYNATCNNGSLGVVGSSAFIDASMFTAKASDFCGILNFILFPGNGYPASGAVVDARGLNSNNTNMAGGPFKPFFGLSGALPGAGALAHLSSNRWI